MTVPDTHHEELIDSILAEALRCVRSGQHFDIDQACERYPEWSDDLQVMLPAILALEKPALDAHRPIPRLRSEKFSTLPSFRDFLIICEIGRGGMGIVYEAVQQPLGRRVALKVLFGSYKSNAAEPIRFQREAEIAASLHHTNIIPVFEAGECGGDAYFAMQYIEGANLRQIISNLSESSGDINAKAKPGSVSRTDGTVHLSGSTKHDSEQSVSRQHSYSNDFRVDLTLKLCVKIALQVAEALDFAHERGVQHRDIKPSNIMIDPDERAWIADFGLAKSMDDEELTATGDVVGTVRYLAPERFRGESDRRSDIYSLGLTLYEMIEQKPAWPGLDRVQLVHQIVSGNGLRLGSRSNRIPLDIQRIIEKAIARDPAERYQRACDMADDLRRYLDGRVVLARKQSFLHTLFLWSRRNKLVASLVATTFLSLVMGTVISLVLASKWRSASIREIANGVSAADSARKALAETARSKDLLKVATGALSEMTSTIITDVAASQKSLSDQQSNFLKRVLQYNRELVELAGSDPESRVRNATAMRSTAGIHELLGDRKQALIDIGNSITIWRDLNREFPNTAKYQFGISQVLLQQGTFFAEDTKYSEAVSCYTDARDWIRAIAADALDSSTGRMLGTIENNLGNIHQELKRYPDAIDAYGKATIIQTSLLSEDPGNSGIRAEVACTFHNLALTQTKNQDLDKAMVAADSAIRIRKELCEQFPNNHSFRFDLASSINASARIAFERGDFPEAIRLFEDAQPYFEKLVTEYSSIPRYRLLLADCLSRTAMIYERLNRREESIRIRTKAIFVHQQIVDSTSNLSERLHLAHAQLQLANLLESSQPDEGLKWAEAGAANCRILLEEEKTSMTFRECLVKLSELQGRILWQKKRQPATALPLFEEAEKLLSEILLEAPDNRTWDMYQASLWCNLGLIHVELNRAESSIPWFNRSIDLFSQIEATTANNENSRRALSRAYERRGDANASLRNYSASLADRERAYELQSNPTQSLVINLCLSHARCGQTDLAVQRVNQIVDSDLSATQRRYLARVFAILAAQEPNDIQRNKLLDSTKRQLGLSFTDDPAAVSRLEQDRDFKDFWLQVNPLLSTK